MGRASKTSAARLGSVLGQGAKKISEQPVLDRWQHQRHEQVRSFQ
jgi:hypothetical protein